MASDFDIRGLALFIVAKHRSGKVDDVKMRFVNQYARFQNWDEDYITTQEVVASRMNTAGGDSSLSPYADGSTPFTGGSADLTAPSSDEPAPF